MTPGSTWGVLIGLILKACLQGGPRKGLEGLEPNFSLLPYKIHNLKQWIATSRCFPKADFILGHPVLLNPTFIAENWIQPLRLNPTKHI